MMKKMNEYDCPECGNDIDNETIEIEQDIESICMTMSCGKCSAIWREYFKIIYDGYSYNTKLYDTTGENILD